jgi:hypothetical protein
LVKPVLIIAFNEFSKLWISFCFCDSRISIIWWYSPD